MDEPPWQMEELPWQVDKLPWQIDELPWQIDELPWQIDEPPRQVDERPWQVDALPANAQSPRELPAKRRNLSSRPGGLRQSVYHPCRTRALRPLLEGDAFGELRGNFQNVCPKRTGGGK